MPRRVEPAVRTVTVDRVACTGHGICHQLAGPAIELDEWGYPIPGRVGMPAELAEAAIRMCPAQALRG